MNLKSDAEIIIKDAIQKVLPDEAVVSALKGKTFDTGRIYVVAAGKAAWQMAKTASDILKEQITAGIVITKYGHVKGNISNITCFEAGHPIPDDNSYRATGEVLTLVNNLHEHDTVLFLLSGGGSTLFEKPLVSKEEMADITGQLLECGADIVEINTVRKRLSAVKGGKFAKLCEPAHIYSIVLSDIIGDPLDMIASGPAYPDSTTCSMAEEIIKKYNLSLSDEAEKLLKVETPKSLSNVETIVTGSVRNLCKAAAEKCRKMGYETFVLTDQLCCEAREAGTFLACIAKTYQNTNHSLAFIAGGETVVHVTGDGKGGRNQELVLSAALGIDGLMDTAVFSIGSDGTDGPTDAAGGYADNNTKRILEEKGVNIYEYLRRNDAYNALKKCDGLIFTGATGTNVNDVAVMLIKR